MFSPQKPTRFFCSWPSDGADILHVSLFWRDSRGSWNQKESLAHQRHTLSCWMYENITTVFDVPGENLVFDYCLIDTKAAVAAIEEHLRQHIDRPQEAFLSRLVSTAPHCFHHQLWLLYLHFVVERETKPSLGIVYSLVAWKCINTTIVAETLACFETAISCVPSSWEVSELFLLYLSKKTENEPTSWTNLVADDDNHSVTDRLLEYVPRPVSLCPRPMYSTWLATFFCLSLHWWSRIVFMGDY